ncbi:protein of unknown function [endosymbiont DhMRE of Dentiscutata heterogama]|uniref:hypothetical protein n=1 Tax=endosymbiont DhMRE of Dentiscutata heterogama TaxID=1609546 RepID=UPI000629D72E|nr:hypothetical protein [endosymbiont DhMRE of Dentiscutata heterogama]CFW93362.1 protein of unknown function [endosymbiont DhMRE of Dentiscutata heterogama]
MENENKQNFPNSFIKECEDELLSLKEENERQLKLQKKELEEVSNKKLEEIKNQQKKADEEKWRKIEARLKVVYWLIGTSFLFSVILSILIFFLVKK